MGGAAFLRVHCAALLRLGAATAWLGTRHRGGRGLLQRLCQLVPDLRQPRLSADGYCRLGTGDDVVEHAAVWRSGGGCVLGTAVPTLSPVRPFLACRLATL